MPHSIETLTYVASQFQFSGTVQTPQLYGFGHINDTYLAANVSPNQPRYILQRINHQVFKNPAALMENVAQVTAHLRAKIVQAGGNPERETLNLIPTLDGGHYLRTAAGEFWRAYLFIEGTKAFQVAENAEHVFNAGLAFGRFLTLLDDFPASSLSATIPDFHHTPRRYETFLRAVEADTFGRAREVQPEIDFIRQRAEDTARVMDAFTAGKLPQRVTHNDTKFNNVMIDENSGAGICVIDLDTVMPGVSLYDFGDAIRSISNTAEEDERDLTKVHFNRAYFAEFTRGYAQATADVLVQEEIDLLAFSAKLLTLEGAIRFLTDYLVGDTYYKIHRPAHNVDRCRTQIRLIAEMEASMDWMQQAVSQNFRR